MATIFLDLDGTLFYEGTNTPLPGAAKKLRKWLERGDAIVLVTARPDDDCGVEQALEYMELPQLPIIANLPSPRIVINNKGAHAINHPTDAPWD